METYTVEGWLDDELIADERGIEESAVENMISELKEEGYSVLVFLEL